MPTGRGFSLDAHWRGRGGTVPVWCRRLLQFQLALVYLSTGLLKTGKTWHEDGTATYFALVNPYNRHFAISGVWASLQPWVLRPATYITLYWEIAFPLFLVSNWISEVRGRHKWPRDLRWLFLGLGLVVHGGIQVFLYTVAFSALALSTYFSFLRPEEARALIDRVLARFGRSRTPPEPR
jgi:hypothetical protein